MNRLKPVHTLYRRVTPTGLRNRLAPALHASADLLRGRGSRETAAALLAVLLAFVLLPLVLLGAAAWAADDWWLRGLLLAGAAAVLAVGALLRPHRLLGADLGAGHRRPTRTDLPPEGHRHQVPTGWRPAVTVVVTAYNESRYLGEALRSLLGQDLPDFECIVVDDGSTDLTIDVAAGYAAVDGRFRVFQHEGNAGLPAARNTGLSHTRAPWVTFLDGDDFLWPGALSRRLEAVQDTPNCAGAYCDWRAVPQDGGPRTRPTAPRSLHRATFPAAQWETPFIASAPVLRTEVVRALGGFSEGLGSAEDFEFYLRLLRAGYWVGYASYVGIGYRQVPGSMIRARPALHAEIVRTVVDSLEAEIGPDAIPGAIAPYTRPLSYYVRESAVLRRQLRFLALALLTGDADQTRRMLNLLNRDLLLLPMPFDPVEEAYRYAVQRAGLSGPEDVSRRNELRRRLGDLLGPLLAPATAATPRDAGTPATALAAPRATVVAKTGRVVDVRQLRRVPRLVADGQEDHARGAVVLVPSSRYHVDDLGPLAEQLAERGVPSCFMVPPKAPETVLTELAKYTDVVLSWEPGLPDRSPVAGVVVLNDWGPTRELVECADRHGAATFAKVEGVQDFADADTGQQRLAYRRARYVLGQGPNDVKALPGRDVHVVGSTRLERIWHEPPASPGPLDPVLINFNFTYNVLTDQADAWIVSTQGGIEDADRSFVVSMHPAQKARYAASARNVTDQPIRHEALRSGALVSRFSTVIYEAMARGVPVVYHNPHGELVPDFQDPRGAFLRTTSRPELRDAIRELGDWQADYRSRCAGFFADQVDVDPGLGSAARGAAVIASLL